MSDNCARRRALVVGLALVVAAIHVVGPGTYLHGQPRILWNSYFSDLVLPFTVYFLLAQQQTPALPGWQIKFAIAAGLPSVAETCQYFGIPLLGSTFDVLDYAMYVAGALSAVVVDTQLLARILPWWKVPLLHADVEGPR